MKHNFILYNKINFKLIKGNMIRILQIIDISQMFNHFAQNKCINHQKRRASSVCLHEDCWKSESDKAFYCEDCNDDHNNKHGNLMRFNTLFTDELLENLDEHSKTSSITDKLKERRKKFEQNMNDLYRDIEQSIRLQFTESKKLFENQSIESFQLKIDNIEKFKNSI